MSAAPALLIAGTHSGCGKTTITLGIMAALRQRGLQVRPFKCGPDFIDPSLHEMVSSQVSRNLDVRMCGKDFVRACFTRHNPPGPPGPAGRGIAVVEGVMGLFDGAEGSAAHLAKTLGLPVLLVVDVRSAAESVAAVVKGFASLDPELKLAGVICNRVGSLRHAELIRAAIAKVNVPLIGFLPREAAISIPSRHLGLHMGEENPLDQAAIATLASLVEDHLDLDLLLHLAAQATQEEAKASAFWPKEAMPKNKASAAPVRIGLARDAAFCFYYADNLEMLAAAGAELVPFSPLADTALPPNLQGLYLGGGYPELHAARLAANDAMRAAIKDFSAAGKPVYAECGGFMYLCRNLRDLDGLEHHMCGVYPFYCAMNAKLRRLGYRNPRQQQASFFGPAEMSLSGHEFHYSSLTPLPLNSLKEQGVRCVWQLDKGQAEGFQRNNTLAGYIHLHWGRTPQAPAAFVRACQTFAF